MLLNIKPLVEKARDGKYAIAHINILNLEWARATIETAKETNSPIILAMSDAVAPYFGGYTVMPSIVTTLIKEMDVKVPIAIHLDHGSYEGCLKAIESGFTSIMFDGSKLSFDENIKKTKELIRLAHEKNISVEAEVGSIGGVEDGVVGVGEIADPNECKTISDLGIDALACGIGNIHGKYPDNWQGLNFDTLKTIKDIVPDMPLVLHGGTGIPDDMIKKAISLGICKINVNTELHLSFAEAIRKYVEDGKDKIGKGYDVRSLSKDGIEGIKKTVKRKLELFGSIGKA